MFQAEIEEYPDLNLYMDEIYKVRGLVVTSRLPETLVFEYKGGSNRIWALHHILKEGLKTPVKIYSSMKRTGRFTQEANAKVFKRINDIRSS